jgi:hypothetical protein
MTSHERKISWLAEMHLLVGLLAVVCTYSWKEKQTKGAKNKVDIWMRKVCDFQTRRLALVALSNYIGANK